MVGLKEENEEDFEILNLRGRFDRKESICDSKLFVALVSGRRRVFSRILLQERRQVVRVHRKLILLQLDLHFGFAFPILSCVRNRCVD